MDNLERDIEFQSDGVTLRMAPWLDMPRLRSKMQENIAAMVESGDFNRHYPQFKSDLLSFCEGKYHHAPRSSAIKDILDNVLYTVFREYRNEPRSSRILNHIAIYILQSGSWSEANTLEDEREAYMDDEDRPDIPF